MLIESFLASVKRDPGKLAVADPTRRLTYKQLRTLAKALRSLVLQSTRCDRVGVLMPASAGGLGCMLGVLWAGKTPIPFNFLLQSRELAQIIEDAQIDLLLTTEHFAEQVAELPVKTLFLEQVNLKRRYLIAALPGTPAPPRVKPDDIAAILYTSGTTGKPKGVCLTHENIISNTTAAIEALKLTPAVHLLGIIPPFHVFGLSVVNFLPLVLGASITFIPRFSPQAAYKAIAEGGISVLMAVPSMYAAIARLKSVEPSAFKDITLAASGGEPLPKTVYDLFHEKTGVHLIEGYGLTETSPIISIDLPWQHEAGTVGHVLPNVEAQLRDENGGVLSNDAEGELFVRGPSVMKGYYNKPDETAAVIDADGWFRTGDIVRFTESGHLKITGRAKDLIITGGENVYPREVEAVLEQHPAVAEAAVVGQPDASRGEVVVAFITLKENQTAEPNDLRAFCKGHLANFKVPRQIQIKPDLPRGPTGKILKRELRKLLEKGEE